MELMQSVEERCLHPALPAGPVEGKVGYTLEEGLPEDTSQALVDRDNLASGASSMVPLRPNG